MDIIDRKALGQEIKRAREKEHISREKISEEIGITYRYLQAIENYGRNASCNVLFSLCKRFNISVDKYLYPEKTDRKSSLRYQVDSGLDQLQDHELLIVDSTICGIKKSKTHVVE